MSPITQPSMWVARLACGHDLGSGWTAYLACRHTPVSGQGRAPLLGTELVCRTPHPRDNVGRQAVPEVVRIDTTPAPAIGGVSWCPTCQEGTSVTDVVIADDERDRNGKRY